MRYVRLPNRLPSNTNLVNEDPSLPLVEQIQKGIALDESFRRLVDLHRPRVRSFFVRKGFSPEEVKDLTQDVFVRVFKAIATFRRESRFERWLFEVVESVYKNELRRRGADKRDGQEQSLDASPLNDSVNRPGLDLPAPGPSVLEDVIEREHLATLQAALQELPDQMRQCCLLRYGKGLKYHEIATVMKISIETVKAHLYQARKRLMARLGGGEG